MPNDEIHPTNRSVRRVVPSSGPLGAPNASLKSGRDQEISTDEAGWIGDEAMSAERGWIGDPQPQRNGICPAGSRPAASTRGPRSSACPARSCPRRFPLPVHSRGDVDRPSEAPLSFPMSCGGSACVNGGRKLTPFRRLKIDPLGVHSSVDDPGTRPRSRSLMR